MKRKVMMSIFVTLMVLSLAWLIYGMLGDRRFVWVDTFDHNSDEPFGCQLFDKMAEATLPNGYSYCKSDLDTLFQSGRRRSFLLVSSFIDWDPDSFARLDSCVRSGDKLMLVTTGMSLYSEEDDDWWDKVSDGMYTYSYFDKEELAKSLKGKITPDTLLCDGGIRIAVPSTLLISRFTLPDKRFVSTCRFYKLASASAEQLKDHWSVSARVRRGRGEVYIVTTPLLFTNYGVLDSEISRFLGYQLSQIADNPVVRIAPQSLSRFARDVNQPNEKVVSPLYFMLDRPPLRWALYTLVAAVVLLMFFTARRRQRVIPVMTAPVNRNLEFVRILGTIYFRHHDNHDLLCKKYTYFREELRRTILIDIDDMSSEQSNLKNLSQRTGLSEDDVAETLQLVRSLTAEGVEVSNQQLTEAVMKIDEIIKQL